LAASLSGYVDKIGETAYNIRELGSLLDFANVMTYDYHGFWDKKAGHHSPIKAEPGDPHPDYNMVRTYSILIFHQGRLVVYKLQVIFTILLYIYSIRFQ